jgi:hypothetical protein
VHIIPFSWGSQLGAYHTPSAIKAKLEVRNETLNEKYLGVPTNVGRSRGGAFKYIKDRIWSHIQGWMERVLSAGGKDVLIKSMAQALPIFSMACFKLPRGLCLHINSLIQKFWWNGSPVRFHGKTCANQSTWGAWGSETLNYSN